MLSDAISEVLIHRNAEDWLSELRLAGIQAARNNDIAGILSDDYMRKQELIVSEDTPELGEVIHAGVAPRLSETQPILGATPTFGEETEAVLLELGYEVEEIDALRAEGVIPPLA